MLSGRVSISFASVLNRCNRTSLCSQDLLLEDVLAQVRRREHRDDPRGPRRPERQGKGPTSIADVFALKRAGCDPLRRQQQRRASPAVQSWLDFQRSQGGVQGGGAPMRSEEQGYPEPGDVEAGGVIARAVPQALGVF